MASVLETCERLRSAHLGQLVNIELDVGDEPLVGPERTQERGRRVGMSGHHMVRQAEDQL